MCGVDHRTMVQSLIPVPQPTLGARAEAYGAGQSSAVGAHACCRRAYRRGQRPEIPAGTTGSAHAVDDRSNTLTCASLTLFRPSSPGAPKLCGRPWVKAVAGLRLCDTHMQQASPGFHALKLLTSNLPFTRQGRGRSAPTLRVRTGSRAPTLCGAKA